MKGNRKKAIFFLTGIFCFLGFLILINLVSAATSTIRGKAYWGQYEYLYFNCIDDVIGNRLNETSNLSGAGRYVDPPAEAAFHFYSEPCTDIVHGVYIADDGVVSGKAWNPSFGLVSFEFDGINDPPDGYGAVNNNCSESCNPSRNCMACYVPSLQTLYGWGIIEDESIPLEQRWIKLHAYNPSNLTKIYTNYDEVIYPDASLELGDFAGTASSTYGDLDFNCQTEGYSASNTCATRDYKVYIKNLILGRLSAPNWSYSDACSSMDALRAVLKWDRFSGTQTAYEIVINDSNTLSTTTNEFVCWTGKITSPAQQHTFPGNIPSHCPDGLAYDTAYYWWLRGYDEDGEATDWIQYDSDGLPATFQTFKHEFPIPYFNWTPEDVITSESATFTDDGYVYSAAEPTTPKKCLNFPGLCTEFKWETSDTLAEIASSTASSTEINFYSATNTSVTLSVTDASGYVCSTSTTFRINYDLPLWREVKAE